MGNIKKNRNSNGNGSIYYDNKREKWLAEIQWTDRNGNRQRKKFSGSKKIIVKNKLEEFKRQMIFTKGNIEKSDVTFREFSEYWLNSILNIKLKKTSYNRKELTLEKQVYPYLGEIPINQITHHDVQEMVNNLNKAGFSYSTVKKAYEAVNGCLREYRIKTSSSFNPCEGISLPANNQKDISNITFFNDKQCKLIVEEATRKYGTGKPVYRLGNAIVVLLYTGLRIGELLALTWSDLDFDEKTIAVSKNAVVVKIEDADTAHYKLINQESTKTKSGNRIIPMSNTALNAFQELFKINGDKKYVMSTKTGKQVTPRNINRMFHSILKETGIAKNDEDNCGVHTLRHTFASMLFRNGCDIKVVSELLGHSDTKITENIYIHIIQKQKVKAIENIDNFIQS